MITNNSLLKRYGLLALLCTIACLLPFAGNARQDPAGCNANNLNVNIGVTANNVTNGTVVTWFVTVQNPNLPSSCAVTLGPEGLFFVCPGPDGNPTGARTTLIPGGTTIRPGYGLETFEIQCLVNVSSLTAEGKVSAPGSVVHRNPLQDDPANVDKSISVNVFRPCLQISNTCVSAVNPTGNSVTVTYTGRLTNCGNILLQDVMVYADQPQPNTLVLGPITMAAASSTNFTVTYTRTDNLCGPFITVLSASGLAPLDTPALMTASANSQCSIGYQPAIQVTKVCPTQPVQPGGLLTISGVVRNTGNIALTNVTVVNNKPAANTVLLGPITLAVGQELPYTGSYVVPLDSCPPYADTVIASGTSTCGGAAVTHQATASCLGTNSPSIVVTRSCPPAPVPAGGTLNYSGTVTNTGNVTLTNVTVVSDRPAANTRIFGPANLAPGAGAVFTGSYVVPLDSCGPYTNTLVATGRDKCFSVNVTSSVTEVCPGITTPGIRVAKVCPPTLVQPGGTLSYSGSVTNIGDVTLNNVTVYNGSTLIYGPASLAPRTRATFNASYTIPLDSCGPYVDTLVAQGTSSCGSLVTDSTVVACAGTNAPSIRVTKACPTEPVPPGGTLTYTGTVTNTGNVTLTNVMVVNSIPAANTVVFGPVDLAPGIGAAFVGSYTVPLDACGPYADTVVASGADKCFGRVVTSSATTTCPGTSAPAISITQACPANPTAIGSALLFTATVVNTGNITLTNVVVTGDRPTPGTTVLLIATLAPGASTNFTGSFIVPGNLDACSISHTLQVTGRNKCTGTTVTQSAPVVCPVIPAPAITVSRNCPTTAVAPGGTLAFTGSVVNGGNVTLSNIVVTINRPTAGTVVHTVASLAPGATVAYTGSYTVPFDDCSVTDTVTVTAVDRCGTQVSNSSTTTCPITTTPSVAISRICPEAPVAPGDPMPLLGWVTNTGNVTLTNLTLVVDYPEANTLFFGPVTLAPGASAGFIGSFTVPTNYSSCTIASTVTARANNKCTGVSVSASSVISCQVLTAPKIWVSKVCPAIPPAPGMPFVFTGTVMNLGNVALTNIVVMNDRPASNTVVFAARLLAPGQSTNFTASYITPSNCCSVCDTLTATGVDQCTGLSVQDSSTALCPVQFTPLIRITKTCPTKASLPGELLTYTGTISNAGNITLTEVVVYNSMTGTQDPIMGVAALAPGEVQAYTGSFIVPIDFCEPDTVTVEAKSFCGDVLVNHSATSPCPVITTPAIVIMGIAPTAPVVHSQPVTFTGRVINTGNVTLHDVYVSSSMPAPNTVILGPVSLAPGQSTNFTHTYVAPWDCNCCGLVNTFATRGQDRCATREVKATSTITAKYLTNPRVILSLECPTGGTVGQQVNASGTVMNSSDITLTNVIIMADTGSGPVHLLGPITLARGEMQDFKASYTKGRSVRVTATANDSCTGIAVTDQDICGETVPVPVISRPTVSGQEITLTWTSMAGMTYKVQSTDNLPGGIWTDVPGEVVATGSTSSKTLVMPTVGNARYYRVVGLSN